MNEHDDMSTATDPAPDLCESCWGVVTPDHFRWAVLTECSCGELHLGWVHAACKPAYDEARAAA